MLGRDPIFDELFSGLRAFPIGMQTTSNGASRMWTPATDVHETEDAYVIEADLPGVSMSDLDIEVDRHILTLRGLRSRRFADDRAASRRTERGYGAFQRRFAIPEHVDVEHIDAALQDGVLVLTMPKRAEAKPRRIEVKARNPNQLED